MRLCAECNEPIEKGIYCDRCRPVPDTPTEGTEPVIAKQTENIKEIEKEISGSDALHRNFENKF